MISENELLAIGIALISISIGAYPFIYYMHRFELFIPSIIFMIIVYKMKKNFIFRFLSLLYVVSAISLVIYRLYSLYPSYSFEDFIIRLALLNIGLLALLGHIPIILTLCYLLYKEKDCEKY